MDELYHHGIKGQKWGVRRYQNSDGSLTAAGKRRYGVEELDTNKVQANKRTGYIESRLNYRSERNYYRDKISSGEYSMLSDLRKEKKSFLKGEKNRYKNEKEKRASEYQKNLSAIENSKMRRRDKKAALEKLESDYKQNTKSFKEKHASKKKSIKTSAKTEYKNILKGSEQARQIADKYLTKKYGAAVAYSTQRYEAAGQAFMDSYFYNKP